jgi:aspartyl-tRNA(Asn)/glutamyl-tRNA(Gln) amidotransferase subunit B
MGHPGVLPVVNEKAVEYMIRISLALNCKITELTKFDRKNYYYPDLPKNYQISQQYLPFARDGFLEITVGGQAGQPATKLAGRRVGIGNVHLEEDAGKNIHPEGKLFSGVDLNRTGIPLVEIVTKPDLRSPEEAEIFMNNLRDILLYTEVSDCKMQEGSLRFEANISVREKGQTHLPPRVEIKNLNSFKIVLSAIKHEIERQTQKLKNKETVLQETRLWDDEKQITRPMRSKEEAHDYRYFPEPDLPPLEIDKAFIEETKKQLPGLPLPKMESFIKEYSLTDYDAAALTTDRRTADYFEKAAKLSAEPKLAANWIMTELLGRMNVAGLEDVNETKITPESMAELIALIKKGTISGKIAKTVFDEMFKNGGKAEKIVAEKGLVQITDTKEIETVIDKVIAANPKIVDEIKGGKAAAMGFLTGQVMKESRGKANPQMVNELLQKKILG